jgi:hypothetical protein
LNKHEAWVSKPRKNYLNTGGISPEALKALVQARKPGVQDT